MKKTRSVAAKQKSWFTNSLNWYDGIPSSTAVWTFEFKMYLSCLSHHGRTEIQLQTRACKVTLSWSWVNWDEIWRKAPVRISLINSSSASISCSWLGKPKGLRIIKKDVNLIYHLHHSLNIMKFSEITRTEQFISRLQAGAWLQVFKQGTACFSFVFSPSYKRKWL